MINKGGVPSARARRKYLASHQRSPRGRGRWLFELRRRGELAQGVDYFGAVGTFGLTGVGATTYGFALKAAKAKAREIGATDIVVLPYPRVSGGAILN